MSITWSLRLTLLSQIPVTLKTLLAPSPPPLLDVYLHITEPIWTHYSISCWGFPKLGNVRGLKCHKKNLLKNVTIFTRIVVFYNGFKSKLFRFAVVWLNSAFLLSSIFSLWFHNLEFLSGRQISKYIRSACTSNFRNVMVTPKVNFGNLK